MTSQYKSAIGACLLSVMLAACAASPWQDMSESEIASWKSLGVDAASAQQYVDQGFNVDTASPWVKQGFKAEKANDWAEHDFSAEEARAWRDGGFDLDQARDNRAEGLTPITAGK